MMTVAHVDLTEIVPERDQDEDAIRELSQARLIVMHNGNFTTAVFVSPEAGAVAGVAKRNPGDDPMVEERGENLAIIRAYRAYQEGGWQ